MDGMWSRVNKKKPKKDGLQVSKLTAFQRIVERNNCCDDDDSISHVSQPLRDLNETTSNQLFDEWMNTPSHSLTSAAMATVAVHAKARKKVTNFMFGVGTTSTNKSNDFFLFLFG